MWRGLYHLRAARRPDCISEKKKKMLGFHALAFISTERTDRQREESSPHVSVSVATFASFFPLRRIGQSRRMVATRLSFSPAEKLSARSPLDGPRSARLQSRTPAKDKPGRQSFRESPSVRTERLAKPTEPQAVLPAAATSEPAAAEMSAQAAEANAQAAEVSRHEEEVLTAARKWSLGGATAR